MRTKKSTTGAANVAEKSVNTNKVSNTEKGKAEKVSEKAPAKPKEKKVTIASKLDEVILKGGPWEALIAAATEQAKKLGSNMKFNAGLIRAHIAYREKKNAKYLGNLKVTDKGIVASKKAAA